MTDIDVLTDRFLVRTEEVATIGLPIEKIDIADWLFNLPDAEYQRCAPPDHIAGASTTTDDGRPMSINVEQVGGTLVVQHYVAEIHERDHCHMVSLTDVQTPAGWSKIQVVWDLRVVPIDQKCCRYTNSVTSYPTRSFVDTLVRSGQSFEQTAARLQEAVADHNRRETPLFAASIERKARATSA